MDFIIFHFDKYRGMFEQSKSNTVEEYLAPLKEMFAKYVPVSSLYRVRNDSRRWWTIRTSRGLF